MTLRASPQSLARRVAQLEANARAAHPLLVRLRCFSGGCVRITGPAGAEWLRGPDEAPEAFLQRVEADAREAMTRCATRLYVLAEHAAPTDQTFNKEEFA